MIAAALAASTSPAGCGSADLPAPIAASKTDRPAGCGADAPAGSRCNPIVVATFPFSDRRDSRDAPSDVVDAYFCEPDIDESGGEIFYEVDVPIRSRLTASVRNGPGADIDLHLQARDGLASSCLTRADRWLDWVLEPGKYLIVADTFAGRTGVPLAGTYELDVHLTPLLAGPCAVESVDLEMFWTACAPGIDCVERTDASGRKRRFLRTPSMGPVVKEAHLVTVEDVFDGGFPLEGRERIERHYARSQAATGFAIKREEPWAPSSEGYSHFGQGSTGVPIPVEAEAWYITMYWRERPARGTRMIVVNEANGRAVVAAAGYETGPGSNESMAGVTEEIHAYLGTHHRAPLFVGFAVDQGLPLGPIDCAVDER